MVATVECLKKRLSLNRFWAVLAFSGWWPFDQEESGLFSLGPISAIGSYLNGRWVRACYAVTAKRQVSWSRSVFVVPRRVASGTNMLSTLENVCSTVFLLRLDLSKTDMKLVCTCNGKTSIPHHSSEKNLISICSTQWQDGYPGYVQCQMQSALNTLGKHCSIASLCELCVSN